MPVAITSFSHFTDGHPEHVREGVEFQADDAVVVKFPHLFRSDGIEAATAAPGEKRSVPARKAAPRKRTTKKG